MYAAEQATQRFLNIPSEFVQKIAYVPVFMLFNWATDYLTGPPLDDSGAFWYPASMMSNLKDSLKLGVQDTIKFTIGGTQQLWRDQTPPPLSDLVPPVGSSAYM